MSNNYLNSICPICNEKVKNVDKHMWLEPVAIYIDENGAEMYHRECFKNNIFNIDKGGVTKFPRLWSEIKEEFEEKGSISNG